MSGTYTILCDIGGTHARFARADQAGFTAPMTVRAADFPSLITALDHYRGHHDLPSSGQIAIATAAVPGEDNIWRFHNDNRWEIDPASLAQKGWETVTLVNDFVATARAIPVLPDTSVQSLRKGHPAEDFPRAVMGPGTGLGLAYLIPLGQKGWHVQQTHGGHMLAATATTEQQEIVGLMRDLTGRSVIIPEDLASGRALPDLYCAVCKLHGKTAEDYSAAELLTQKIAKNKEPALTDTWRLFHEFLGLFAHNIVITGHAYGGLYLTGGLMIRLYQSGQFDQDAFLSSFLLPVAPPVLEALEHTPLSLINEPYTALYGLLALRGEQ